MADVGVGCHHQYRGCATPTQMNIRFAMPTHADALAIAAVQVRSWQAAYRDLLPADYLAKLSIQRRVNRWLSVLREERVLVAKDDAGRLVAFCAFGHSNDDDGGIHTAEIYALYALPHVWGQGYGHALLATALDHLRSDEYTLITLWVLAGNQRGIHFYTRQGFTFDGTRKTDVQSNTLVFYEQRMQLVLS